jgi:hypothetical protein
MDAPAPGFTKVPGVTTGVSKLPLLIPVRARAGVAVFSCVDHFSFTQEKLCPYSSDVSVKSFVDRGLAFHTWTGAGNSWRPVPIPRRRTTIRRARATSPVM